MKTQVAAVAVLTLILITGIIGLRRSAPREATPAQGVGSGATLPPTQAGAAAKNEGVTSGDVGERDQSTAPKAAKPLPAQQDSPAKPSATKPAPAQPAPAAPPKPSKAEGGIMNDMAKQLLQGGFGGLGGVDFLSMEFNSEALVKLHEDELKLTEAQKAQMKTWAEWKTKAIAALPEEERNDEKKLAEIDTTYRQGVLSSLDKNQAEKLRKIFAKSTVQIDRDDLEDDAPDEK